MYPLPTRFPEQFNPDGYFNIPSGDLIKKSKLPKLDKIIRWARNNEISEINIPDDVLLLGMQRYIDLSTSKTSASSVLDDLGCLRNLWLLNISRNNLHNLPSSLSGLRSLKTLDLSYNNFTVLPSVILLLPKLEDLLIDKEVIINVDLPKKLRVHRL